MGLLRRETSIYLDFIHLGAMAGRVEELEGTEPSFLTYNIFADLVSPARMHFSHMLPVAGIPGNLLCDLMESCLFLTWG